MEVVVCECEVIFSHVCVCVCVCVGACLVYGLIGSLMCKERQGAGLAPRNISIIPRVPEVVLGVRELFPNSAVTHSSTESTYP